MPIDIKSRLRDAVQKFWLSRKRQQKKQVKAGKIDAGTRGAVTGGTQMGALEVLVRDILLESGLKRMDIKTRTALELPGFYRPEKKWDLIVISENKLVLVMEFKSQVGPSFGNNFNNRSEEAIGSASDIWVAFREGRFGDGPPPFLGYFFLLEDCPAVHKPVKSSEPYFKVDPVFARASYSKRYELLGRRLVLERLYSAACLILSRNGKPASVSEPAEDLSFNRFVAALKGHVLTFINSQK